jgi:putative ABC transport system ATP-binding protein
VTTILQMRDLCKHRDAAERETLFSRLTASLASQERVALLGVSGQGKSTLLRIIASLDKADAGAIEMQGRLQSEVDPRLWRMQVCYVAQLPVMLSGSIEHNLRLVSTLHRRPYEDKLVARLWSELGLGHIKPEQAAADLSGGEKQRVALLRSLLLRPQVLLLDEVTSALDNGSKGLVEQTLAAWHRQEGTAMIWVTHDVEQAQRTSDTVWFMAEHTLLEQSSVPAFFNQPSTEAARMYINRSES